MPESPIVDESQLSSLPSPAVTDVNPYLKKGLSSSETVVEKSIKPKFVHIHILLNIYEIIPLGAMT